MADRRSLFSRFWPPSASRRPTPTQTITPPPATAPPSSPSRRPPTTTQTATPATAPPPSPRRHPTATTQPATDHQTAEQLSITSSEPRKSPSSQTQAITSTKTTSPSRETTQSSSPSSPIRRVAKSRSPPPPSSPAQNTGSQTPKRASHPRLKSPSPKAGPSSSPKRTQPKSPSKESTQPSQEVSSNEKDPKPAASQQEPQLNAEAETDSGNEFNGKTLDGTSFKHDEVGSTTEPLVELNAKPEEAEDVKEVVQATNTEAIEETKKENSGSEDQIIEKTEIPSKPDQVQREEQEALQTKETLGGTPGNIRNSQSEITASTISNTHNKSAQSNGKHTPLHKQIAISDKHASVITLAGENRGASMQVESTSSKREWAVHIHRSYKINPDESPEATTDGEGSSDQKKTEDANSTDDQPTETYVNNNAQGINNSIVFNSSITEGSPGVHMVVTHLPKEPIQSTNKAETRKAESNTTRTEKLTYQPTVRRRCLKGLFLETSDSDLENPEKPRRHGCRVGCEKRDTQNNVDVL